MLDSTYNSSGDPEGQVHVLQGPGGSQCKSSIPATLLCSIAARSLIPRVLIELCRHSSAEGVTSA